MMDSEMDIELDYDEVFSLVKQLSYSSRERLTLDLLKEMDGYVLDHLKDLLEQYQQNCAYEDGRAQGLLDAQKALKK